MSAPFAPSPAARRYMAEQIMRRSLGAFHEEAFRALHGDEALVRGPHLDAMVHKLEQLSRGDISRLLIAMPPRHGKSELASGSLPAWILGNDPKAKVTIASYGLDLSKPLLNNVRTIVKAPFYRRVFPDSGIRKGQYRSDYFIVQGGGSARATSKDGTVTGHGTHFLVVDDFHKANEAQSPIERHSAIETFRNTFLNRFDNLNDARMLIIMQRIVEDDLIGWALRSGKWDYLCMPAIAEQDEDIPLGRGRVWHRKKDDVLAPLLMSRDKIMEKRDEMGPGNWGPQFQQNTFITDGALIDWGWFGQYESMPPRTFFHKIVQTWDPAATDRITSDYSVGQTWGFRDGYWYLLDVIRAQLAFTDLHDRVLAWHRQWKADALIVEGSSIGEALVQLVKKAALPGLLRAPKPRTAKIDRLAAATPHLRSGCFLLPASAPWLEAMRHELLAFPNGRNDDHVDALSQFVNFVFRAERWVYTDYDENGRPDRVYRKDRRGSRYYDGDRPSAGSYP